MNAVTLLKRDHRNVEALFERYRNTSSGKREIIGEITRELTKHMDAEERELYPVLRESLPDGRSLMDDAVTEHKEARGILAELESADAESFDTDARVNTLRRAVEHHVSDEEQKVFPEAQQTLGKKRLDELGTRIARAKLTAPERPSKAAARNAPSPTVGGILAAATDRVKNLFTGEERKAPRRAARTTRSRKARSAGKKAAPGKKARRSRARTTATRRTKAGAKAKARKTGSARRGRR